MAQRSTSTCADCYFRRAGLCALPTEVPCPTFRAYERGAFVTLQQQAPPLLRPPLLRYAAQHAAA